MICKRSEIGFNLSAHFLLQKNTQVSTNCVGKMLELQCFVSCNIALSQIESFLDVLLLLLTVISGPREIQRSENKVIFKIFYKYQRGHTI